MPYDPDPLEVPPERAEWAEDAGVRRFEGVQIDPEWDEPRPTLSFRGCVWVAILAALSVFWIGVGVGVVAAGWLG